MILLGLDLASRLTGWCCGSGEDPPACGAWQFPPIRSPDGSYDYGLLLATLNAYLSTLHGWLRFEALSYEAPILITGRRGDFQDRQFADTLDKLRLLYPLGAFVEFWARVNDVQCFEVGVREIKREVTGDSLAGKQDLVTVARACGLQLPTVGADDAADAFGAWLLLLRDFDPARSQAWDTRIRTSRGGLL